MKGVYVEYPEGLVELLHARAAADRRTLKQVLLLAAEQYLGVTPEQYQRPPVPQPTRPRKRKGEK